MKKKFMKLVAVCCCATLAFGLLGCQRQVPYEPTQEDLTTWETEGMRFASYDYPIMPLTTVEPAEGLMAERDITVHLMEPIGDWGEAVEVQDEYRLTNTTKEDMAVTFAYPYLYGWYYDEGNFLPTMTVNGVTVENSAFSDVIIENDEYGWLSYSVLKEQFDAAEVYGDKKDWSALEDTPVTIYKVQYDIWEATQEYEDIPEVKIYYENENNYNLILDNSLFYGRDEVGDFIGVTYGYHANKTVTIISLSGELKGFSGAIEIYEKGKTTRWEHGISVQEETATLGQVLDTYRNSLNGYVNVYSDTYGEEDYWEAIHYVLEGYVTPMAEGYSNGRIATLEEIANQALYADRVCYLYQETTIPANGSVTVTVAQNKARNFTYGYDTRFASEPESWFGFEIATHLGSSLDFSSFSAEVTWDEEVVIMADNIIPEKDGTLNLEKELYYIYYLTEYAMKHRVSSPGGAAAAKPVIYLYPEEEMEVSVKLNLDGELTSTWPKYDAKAGWDVLAKPDGTIVDKEGYEYSYLFWEAELNQEWDFSKGFVVAGADSAEFLREKLSYMGLTPTEYNEFIVYWAPILEQNAYNLISFQWENYDQAADLEITPAPDNMLRVYMAYQPLKAPVEAEEQILPVLEREGFTVVEWGGNLLED